MVPQPPPKDLDVDGFLHSLDDFANYRADSTEYVILQLNIDEVLLALQKAPTTPPISSQLPPDQPDQPDTIGQGPVPYVLENQTWHNEFRWTRRNYLSPQQTLVFRDCTFHALVIFEVCNLTGLTLRFENCKFMDEFQGGNRSGRGNQASTYGHVQFVTCEFTKTVSLTDSTFHGLQFQGCTFHENLVIRGIYGDTVHIEDCTPATNLLQIQGEELKLGTTLVIHNTRCQRLDLSKAKQADIEGSENKAGQTSHQIILSGNSQIDEFILDNAVLPTTRVQIQDDVSLQSWMAGNKTRREYSRKTTLGSILCKQASIQRIFLGDTVIKQGAQFHTLQDCKTLFMHRACVEEAFILAYWKDAPEVCWDEASLQGKVTLQDIQLETWSARNTRFFENPRAIGQFFQVNVQGTTVFDGAQFHGRLTWGRCRFQGEASFQQTVFQDVDFGTSQSSYKPSIFHAEANFTAAQFGYAGFDRCEFQQDAIFSQASFLKSKRDHSFNGASFLKGCLFEDIRLFNSINFCAKNTTTVTFHQGLKVTISDDSLPKSRSAIHIRMESAQGKQGSEIITHHPNRIQLNLRRSTFHNLQIRGQFVRLNLEKARLTYDANIALLENWSRGDIRMHDARISNTTLHFSAQFRGPKDLDKIDMFARKAHLEEVTIKGEFIGHWRFLGCQLKDIRFHDLTLDSDLDLSRCSMQQSDDVPAFAGVRFRDRRRKYTTQRPKLILSQCEPLDHLKFTDGCELKILNLRGSRLHRFELDDGECESLLVRRGLQDRTLTLQIHPDVYPVFQEAFLTQLQPQLDPQNNLATEQLPPEQWLPWLEQTLNASFTAHSTAEFVGRPPRIQVVCFQPDLTIVDEEAPDPGEDVDTIAAQEEPETAPEPTPITGLLHAPMTPITGLIHAPRQSLLDEDHEEAPSRSKVRWNRPPMDVSDVGTQTLFNALQHKIDQGQAEAAVLCQSSGSTEAFASYPVSGSTPVYQANTPEERQTKPSLYPEEDTDTFFVGLWSQEKDEERNLPEYTQDWIEVDLSRHRHNPLQYIKKELEHHYRSAHIDGWKLQNFVIKGSDDLKTPNARPVFANVTMEGSTIAGKLFDCAIFEGSFRAESACSFVQASWRNSVFYGPVHLAHTKIAGALECQECIFEDSVTFSQVDCQGSLSFHKASFRGPLSLRENRVSDQLYLKEAELAAPLLIEQEKQSGGLHCEKTKFNDIVQIRDSTWRDTLELSQAVFARECTLRDVKARTMRCLNTEFYDVFQVRDSQWRGDINLQASFFLKECLFKGLTANSLYAVSKDQTTQFKGAFSLRKVTLNTHLSWGHARFSGPLTLEDVRVPDFVLFLGCEFGQDVLIQRLSGEPALSILRSSFAERLLLEDTKAINTIFLERTTCHGPVIMRGTLTPQEALSKDQLTESTLHSVTLDKVQCTNHVALENLAIDNTIDFRHSQFAGDVTFHHIRFYGAVDTTTSSPHAVEPLCGSVQMENVEIHNRLNLRELYHCAVFLQDTNVRQALDARSFSKTLPLHCSLSHAAVTDMTLPVEPEGSLRYVHLLPTDEFNKPDHLDELHQQSARHYAQLYQICLKRKQYQEAREFRYLYRTALRKLGYLKRISYLSEARAKHQPSRPRLNNTYSQPALQAASPPDKEGFFQKVLRTMAATWESTVIQVGHWYDGYGKQPLMILFWMLFFSSLCLGYGLYGWGLDTVGVAWLDTLLTPIGFVFQGLGVAPFGSKFPTIPLKAMFIVHTALIGLMWLNLLALLIPGLITRDRISRILARRTGSK